jgi:hypothetical protein
MKKLFAFLAVMGLCLSSFAQSNITLDLKDAPVRTTLEMMFKQAGIKNYVIENSVEGFVTMNLTDQPFENSLKIVMRAATLPLTYTKENDIWIVKARIFTPQINPIPDITFNQPKNNFFEIIYLNHIDPFDLMSAFGNILFINQFQRYQGGMNGSGMGNFGGGNNNSSFGGNGGFGGQAGNGMGGGAMGGFGGNSFGGMNGGVGGFGGGRNF